jgi:non-ribosomal peptide synthetase component E (peptide arylation enzyme)
MGQVARYTQAMIDTYVAKGYWKPALTVDYWEQHASRFPEQEAVVDSTRRVTWREAVQMIHCLTAAFLQRGLKKDDVLLCQLYNSVSLTLLRLACEKAGIVLALVPTTFREAEIAAILGQTRAVGAVFPARFRHFDYVRMFTDLQRSFDHLTHLFAVGQETPRGLASLDDMMRTSFPSMKECLDSQKFTPFEFTEIVTTSGSTGLPKCVEWTACARLATAREYISRLCLTQHDVVAAFSPSISGSAETLVHRTPPQLGMKTVMLEHFTPEQACQLVQSERVTVAGAVPTHLVRLVHFPGVHDYDLRSLRLLLVSGGSLPYHVGREIEKLLGCKVVQGYGGMDIGAVTVGERRAPQRVRLTTVGKPLEGNVVTLVDPETGAEVPQGGVGVVTVEGPHCVGGYFRNPTATREARRHGKFDMGDLGMFTTDGDLVLCGRVKDIIIRGGQTIHPKEVEDLLGQHPRIAEVALVRMPDEEMGERICAFVVLKPGQTLTFDEMVAFLKAQQIALYKIPERLEVVCELPLVPGGNKVNKRQLEDALQKKLQSEGIDIEELL